MPISMTCPQCGARFSFTDDFRGKKARCQRCQHIFTIEEPPPEVAALPDLELAEPPKPRPASPPPVAKPAAPAPPAPKPPSPPPVAQLAPHPPPLAPPRAASAPPQKPKSRETSANDFDPAAMGLSFEVETREEKSTPLGEKSPPRRASQEKKQSEGELFDDYEDDEADVRPSRKKESSAFGRSQSGGGPDPGQTSEKGKGKKFPVWARIIIFIAGFFVPGVSEISGLVGDGSESPLTRMKRKLKWFLIIAAIGLVFICGGMATLMLFIKR